MATEIKMPQLGETVVEGTITRWLKQEGDTVEEDELLVEISTDKVDSEVPSSASGTIQKILVQEGDTVKVGTALAIVGEGDVASDGGGGGAEAEAETGPADAGAAEVPSGDEGASTRIEDSAPGGAVEVGDKAEQVAEERQREGAAGDQGAQTGGQADSEKQERMESEKADASAVRKEGKGDLAPTSGSSRPTSGTPSSRPGDHSKRGIISPLVRRLADEHDVNLDEIEGTGTGGRIRKQDVLRYVEEGKARREARPAASAEPAPRR
ncbi:MAG: E3 binding domain-containing protein, partial [Actinomycetota bacterium]|nr:E3 binding domain-containing protein [Actinomycetota bacterium]